MTWDLSLVDYFIHAGLIVKCVMLLLIAASVFSWTYIFQRLSYLKTVRQATRQFEAAFWSGENLPQLYTDSMKRRNNLEGLEAVFHAGFKEFLRLQKSGRITPEAVVDNVKRAMRAAQVQEQEKLETYLPFLAIVGTTSPYIGLFGTVWGIMQSFRALASVQQATIAMVAPGIAEALIATALGLFTVIPAVISYNRFASDINRLLNRFDAFQDNFINILFRQVQQPMTVPVKEATEYGVS
ncbi:MAG: protein TolQ [Gammaproteobacteria bacterium RIFCSPHIGHO2_12_FULL_41_20]|nr:MAG: protein TolQ [Gammaproteobacteria bacterium RIFCSPHIGHO2_12_FULL_41_20]